MERGRAAGADDGRRRLPHPRKRIAPATTCCSRARRARCSTSTTAPIRSSRRATAWPATPPPARAWGRRCCTTCWASPRPTPRAWAAGRSRPSCRSTSPAPSATTCPRWARSAAWSPAARAAAAGSTPRRCAARSSSTACRACASPSSTCSTACPRSRSASATPARPAARHPAARCRRHRRLPADLRNLARLARNHRRA